RNWRADERSVWRSPIATAAREGYRAPISMAFSADGSRLAIAYEQGVLVWKIPPPSLLENAREVLQLELGLSVEAAVGLGGLAKSVAFSPTGELLAAGYVDASIRMIDLANDGSIQRLTGAPQSIISVEFIDNERLVSLDAMGEARVWTSYPRN